MLVEEEHHVSLANFIFPIQFRVISYATGQQRLATCARDLRRMFKCIATGVISNIMPAKGPSTRSRAAYCPAGH